MPIPDSTTQGTVETQGADISALKTTVGGAGSGLVKGLADEIVRATAAEGAEATRATGRKAISIRSKLIVLS